MNYVTIRVSVGEMCAILSWCVRLMRVWMDARNPSGLGCASDPIALAAQMSL